MLAGLKTFSRPFRETTAACLYEQDQGHVGLCGEEPRNLMYEAEFTTFGAADAQVDLNGKSTRTE